MFRTRTDPLELMPVLSRGKHRTPRQGACFMEMASCLAGERWSDKPHCTHPLLAELARLVNDFTSDQQRPRLAPLVPSVIGLTSDDPRVDARISLRCAMTALPLVSEERQRVMALSIVTADHVLARLDGRPADGLTPAAQRALDDVPLAAKWADNFSRGTRVSIKRFRRFGAPTTVVCAVPAIAEALACDPDQVLYDLLAGAISDFPAEAASPADAEMEDRHRAFTAATSR